MIEHVWTVLCAYSLTDKESNNVSLIQIIEQIVLLNAELPMQIGLPMELVTLWARSAEDKSKSKGKGRVLLARPSGHKKAIAEYPIDLSEKKRVRQTIRINGIEIKEVGQCYFYVQLQFEDQSKWRTVTKVPLEISPQK